MSQDLELMRARRVLARRGPGTAALELASAVQESVGYLPPALLPELAEKAALSLEALRARLAEQPAIRLAPEGRHRVTVCTGYSCARWGGAKLLRSARQALGVGVFRTSADGAVRIDAFRCFGKCAMAPNVKIDGEVKGAMTEDRFGLLLKMLIRRS